MGTISLFSARTAAVIGRPESEEDALDLAKKLSAIFSARAVERQMRGLAPRIELELIARSGLLGISVPTEFGGIDVSNSIVSDVAALVSQADASIGRYLQDHFYILDIVRAVSSEDFKQRNFSRALSGALFGCLAESDDTTAREDLSIETSGSASTVKIPAEIAGQDSLCDWLGLVARTRDDCTCLAILDGHRFPSIDADDFFPYSGRENLNTSREFYLADGSIGTIAELRDMPTSLALRELIGTSIALGTMAATFSKALAIARTVSLSLAEDGGAAVQDNSAVSDIGSMAARLDGARAMVERASKLLDIAQVTPGTATIDEARRSALAADIVVSEAATTIQRLFGKLTAARSASRPIHDDGMASSFSGNPAHTSEHCYSELGALHLATS